MKPPHANRPCSSVMLDLEADARMLELQRHGKQDEPAWKLAGKPIPHCTCKKSNELFFLKLIAAKPWETEFAAHKEVPTDTVDNETCKYCGFCVNFKILNKKYVTY